MEDYIKNAPHLKDLPERCWIFRNDKFNLTVPKEDSLPVIPKKYEYVLKKFGIRAYSIFEIEKKGRMSKYIRYWDEYNYAEEEIELPMYEFYDNEFHFVGMHKGKVPTKKAVEAAKKLSQKVDPEISSIRKEEKRILLKSLMGQNNAVYAKRGKFKGNLDEGLFENYYVFYVKRMNGTNTDHIIIFDLNKIYNEDVVLELPESDIKFILGKNNCQVNRWRSTLAINTIKVIVG